MEKRKRTTYHLSIDLLNKLNKLSRDQLPNKSALVEKLLREWLKKNIDGENN